MARSGGTNPGNLLVDPEVKLGGLEQMIEQKRQLGSPATA